MKNDTIIFTSIAGFISAIFICSFFDPGFSFFLMLSIVFIGIYFYQRCFIEKEANKNKVLFISLFILFFCIGGIRYEIKNIHNINSDFENYIGQEVYLEGIVINDPEIKSNNQIFVIKTLNYLHGTSSVLLDEKILANSYSKNPVNYGDKIKINGRLSKPENFISSIDGASSTKEFDYVSYLAKDDIFYKLNNSDIKIISVGNGNIIKSILFKIKNYFVLNIKSLISEPEASLLIGIILGEKSGIDKDLQNVFRIVGLSHVVVLSGYNITIVSDAISKFFTFVPGLWGPIFGIVGVILFVVMSGASTTAIRAGIMALIVVLGKILKRDYRPGRALLVAAVIMILFNPKILVFDIGFQLSCIATFAIIYISPIFENKLSFITKKMELRSIISSTLSAQLAVLPLILYKMGIFSTLALPVNILIVPLIPIIMFLGFFIGIFGAPFNAFLIIFAWLNYLLLAYMISVSNLFSQAPFSWFYISWFSTGLLIVSYGLIFAWLFNSIRNKQ